VIHQSPLDHEVRFVPNTSYVDESEGFAYDLVEPFRTYTFVRYDGRYYRPSLNQGRLYASYLIEAAEGAVGPNESVLELEDLPGSVRDEVRQAIVEGNYTAPAGKWDSLPGPLPTRYVRYENETYVLSYAVGDHWATVMTVEEAD
jgi:hypothetical protein